MQNGGHSVKTNENSTQSIILSILFKEDTSKLSLNNFNSTLLNQNWSSINVKRNNALWKRYSRNFTCDIQLILILTFFHTFLQIGTLFNYQNDAIHSLEKYFISHSHC